MTIFPNTTVWGIFFLSQFGIDIIGNTLLLALQINTLLFQPHAKKPIDWIFTHLTLANVMTILFSGIPEVIHYFGIRHFMDDTGYKTMLYMYRVTRGLSLCMTSFLSVFWAIMITPSHCSWAWLKPQLSTYIFPSFFFFWIINMLIYIQVIIKVGAPYNTTEVRQKYSLTYCSVRESDRLQVAVLEGSMVIRDILCMFLMIWTSVYVVRLLFTHRSTVQRVHRTSLCPRVSPETKATHTILALVSCFVFFYWTNSCLTMYISYRHDVRGLENITIFVSACFPIICPFVLIKNNCRSFLRCVFAKMIKSCPQTISVRGLNTLPQLL